MKIANNIIKEHLKNVYFLCGGAYGGKTTMARKICQLTKENLHFGGNCIWIHAESEDLIISGFSKLFGIKDQKKSSVQAALPY